MPPAHPVTARPRSLRDPADGQTVTFVETAAESGGRRSLIELDLAPGATDAPHRNDAYEERLEVLDGTLAVVVDGVGRLVGPGETVLFPAGSTHAVRNAAPRPAAVRVELRPGHQGYERSMQVAYGLAGDRRARTLSHAALLAVWEGRSLPGRRRLACAALRIIARRARRRGMDRALAARDCRW
jgi:quercetin dioxygenase-like cupin family protein